MWGVRSGGSQNARQGEHLTPAARWVAISKRRLETLQPRQRLAVKHPLPLPPLPSPPYSRRGVHLVYFEGAVVVVRAVRQRRQLPVVVRGRRVLVLLVLAVAVGGGTLVREGRVDLKPPSPSSSPSSPIVPASVAALPLRKQRLPANVVFKGGG